MSWTVEWDELDYDTNKVVTNSDVWESWDNTLQIVLECAKDELCLGARVRQFSADDNDPDNGMIVMVYCP